MSSWTVHGSGPPNGPCGRTGRSSRPKDEASLQRLADTLPDGRLEVWEGAGHAVWLDDLDRAVAVLQRALASS